MKRLTIYPRGNLGNQMLQFGFAMNLKSQVPGLEVRGYDLPIWGLSAPVRRWRTRFAPSIRIQDPDVPSLADLFNDGTLSYVKYRGVPLCVESIGDRESLGRLFQCDNLQVDTAQEDEILINVRGDEILKNTHADYGPIPIAYYRQIIDETGLAPVFLGQLGGDYYSNLLRESFPTARFIASQGILKDFQAIRSAQHIVISISTFSWLAAFLSNAKTIHTPLLGFLNPDQRPDRWMLPNDPRYRFHKFPFRKWRATEQQIAELSAKTVFDHITTEKLMAARTETNAERTSIRQSETTRLIRMKTLSKIASFVS